MIRPSAVPLGGMGRGRPTRADVTPRSLATAPTNVPPQPSHEELQSQLQGFSLHEADAGPADFKIESPWASSTSSSTTKPRERHPDPGPAGDVPVRESFSTFAIRDSLDDDDDDSSAAAQRALRSQSPWRLTFAAGPQEANSSSKSPDDPGFSESAINGIQLQSSPSSNSGFGSGLGGSRPILGATSRTDTGYASTPTPTLGSMNGHSPGAANGFSPSSSHAYSPQPSGQQFPDTEASSTSNTQEISHLDKIISNKLVSSTHDSVAVLRSDVTSPLSSVKNFNDLRLPPSLLDGVFQMGFQYPSHIQEKTLPILLAEPPQNMIAQSQSGTGKTAAFVLTALARVKPEQRHPQVLCLAPTYELALQIDNVFAQMGRNCANITRRIAVKGHGMRRAMTVDEHIIIGTPGSVLDWLVKYRVFNPELIRVYILDEADVMIAQQGHQDQSIRIHSKLDPHNCQMLLFSATYEEEVVDFAGALINDPVVITLKPEERTLKNIHQYHVKCVDEREKYAALKNIYAGLTIGQAIIFVHRKVTGDWLLGKMKSDGHDVRFLGGNMEVQDRASVMDQFKKGRFRVLITTNVASRGIDVEQVSVVINFDLPMMYDGYNNSLHRPDFDTYLHRIGRSGRFGKTGFAINFIDDKTLRHLQAIEEHFDIKIGALNTESHDELDRLESEHDLNF